MDSFMANQVMLAYAATQAATDEPSEDSEQGIVDSTVVSEKTNKGNNLPFWGNQQTMNLNPLIWTNITGSPYFKVNLFGLKTYHEVIDEIYYKVSHLEPWERGSRKTSGQTGMCGGVRGVGAGGIVSSAYCLLYKLFTLKLTRKQVNGMLNHCDSPYIRGLGFMYVRYTQPPGDLWNWFEGYLDDEEEIDCKAGGGKLQTIGDMCRQMLTKLEWFDTRFPRIPVNTQKLVDEYMNNRFSEINHQEEEEEIMEEEEEVKEKYPKYLPASHEEEVPPSSHDRRESSKSKRHRRSGSREKSSRKRSRERKRSPPPSRHHHKSSKSRRRSSSRERHRRHKSDRDYDSSRTPDYQDELRRYSEHRKKSKSRRRSRSREQRR